MKKLNSSARRRAYLCLIRFLRPRNGVAYWKLNRAFRAGRQLYYRYCWGCHGARGDGNGENAPYVNPNATQFRSGHIQMPINADRHVCRSIRISSTPCTRGFNFTNMPSWAALTSQQRADLVAFIKTFSPRFKTEKPGDPIPIPAGTCADSCQHSTWRRALPEAGMLEVPRAGRPR